ncbi:GLI pathogenesis-related 2 isoform X2 [Hemitrygon akajei]|uniref:GLI pathogenesis-related 2 isoform X2 n=1 Tax=Hemitrygon akajei TaxID=2704970 RepID=UPI003BF9FDCF
MAQNNPTGKDSGNFASQLLKSVNEYRKKHGAKPLTLNPDISEKATKWAKHLVTSRTLQHSDTSHGENIWCQQSTGRQEVTGQQVADSWYNEIKNYDFCSPGFQKNCGHFTQLVWRESKEMGVGLASDGKSLTIVVAQFDPAGNITNPGYFTRNVLPTGSKVQEDEGPSAPRENASKPDTSKTGSLAPTSGEGSGNFAKQLLSSANKYRVSHGAQSLTLNSQISNDAEKWAKHLVRSRTLKHSDTPYGENIWCQQGPAGCQVTGQAVVDSWYNEIKDYDFSSPGFQKNCGHFTQLVWQDSKEMGVGLASDGKGFTVVVAQFNPAGNITNPGYFAKNVLPTGSKVQQGGSAHKEKVETSDTPEKRKAAPVSGNEKDAFIAELLKEHNSLRAQHQSPPLQVNPELSIQAQKWAEHLANIKTLKHSDTQYGENLWYKWSSNKALPTGKEVSESWYNEIKDYNFKAPGFGNKTGHFTQLVWKATKEMGAGQATDGKGTFFVVAVYKPAGNISNPGYFKENVLPPRKQ